MYPAAELLLALAQELEEVQWSYPSREDGYQVLLTVYCGRETADAHARALGYADSRELGRSARGVRDLAFLFGAGWVCLPGQRVRRRDLGRLVSRRAV